MLPDADPEALLDLLASPAANQVQGGWRGLHRNAVEGSGWVVRSLQAAVWAVGRTTTFRSAVLLAANMGDDADTTAAIAGQLAGAVYGEASIPPEWLDALAWRERLEGAAVRLFDASWLEQGDPDDKHTARTDAATLSVSEAKMPGADLGTGWMTRDWSLRERLAALAAFRPAFIRDGRLACQASHAGPESGHPTQARHDERHDLSGFHQALYDYGWVRVLDWSACRDTEAGRRLMHDSAATEHATEDDLMRVLTTCCRADRFCEGYLDDTFEAGLIGRVVLRAERLLTELEG